MRKGQDQYHSYWIALVSVPSHKIADIQVDQSPPEDSLERSVRTSSNR